MQVFTQDRLIQSEKLTEFNIAYPIYITGWEVRQVQDINKLYARVFYKKLVSNAKAAKVKITCISEFGEPIQEEIKPINDIDEKSYDFFEIYPLHKDTRKIEICLAQGLCLDGKNILNAKPVIVSDTFVPFSREIEYAAGQKLITSAKGYPQENESCWICCCGAINAKDSELCVACKSEKATVFEKITEENINKDISDILAKQKAEQEKEDKKTFLTKRLSILSHIACILSFFVLITDCFPGFFSITKHSVVIILNILGILLNILCICFNIICLKNYSFEQQKKKITSAILMSFSLGLIFFNIIFICT